MQTFYCYGFGTSDQAEAFQELAEYDWSAKRVKLSRPGSLMEPQPRTIHFCGPDCRAYVLETLDISEDAESPQAERAMRGSV